MNGTAAAGNGCAKEDGMAHGLIVKDGRIVTPEQQAEHERERALTRQREATLRAEHRQRLAAIEAAKSRQVEARLDAELAERQVDERRRWLAAHPALSEADFAAVGWPRVRALLLAERARAEHTRAAVSSGRYEL